MMIGVVDYGAGNLRSISMALNELGYESRLVSNPMSLGDVETLLIPGVGSFPKAMASLKNLGLDELIELHAHAGGKVVGICLGMQLLFDSSEEHGGSVGLGLINGQVQMIPQLGERQSSVGWREVNFSRYFELQRRSLFFAHSFQAVPDEDVIVGTYELDAEQVVASVQKANIFGMQFHPEKSGQQGLEILRQVLAI